MNRLINSLRPVARNALRANGSTHLRFCSTPETFLARDDVVERVVGVVKTFDKVDATKVTEKSHFADDLGLDSLDFVEVQMALETEFAIEIPDQEADNIVVFDKGKIIEFGKHIDLLNKKGIYKELCEKQLIKKM